VQAQAHQVQACRVRVQVQVHLVRVWAQAHRVQVLEAAVPAALVALVARAPQLHGWWPWSRPCR